MSTIRVGIIGMGFGKEFISIYQKLRGCEVKAISQRNEKSLNEIADVFGIICPPISTSFTPVTVCIYGQATRHISTTRVLTISSV